jgi:hypothetical protein
VLDRDGQPVPPTVVTAGSRSVLVYALAPVQSNRAPAAVTISVASQDGWHLAGVLGARETVDAIAERVVRNGLDAVLQPLVAGAHGGIELAWIGDGRDIAPARKKRPTTGKKIRPKRPRGATAAKKVTTKRARATTKRR